MQVRHSYFESLPWCTTFQLAAVGPCNLLGLQAGSTAVLDASRQHLVQKLQVACVTHSMINYRTTCCAWTALLSILLRKHLA